MKSKALLVLLAITAFSASAFEVGEFAPLTHTRYGAIAAEDIALATDGSDAYLFFTHQNSVRMLRVGDESHPARVILEETDGMPAVTWTGAHFFVAAARSVPGLNGCKLVATIVDRNGEVIRPRYPLSDVFGPSDPPLAAFNGRVIVLLHGSRVLTVDASGSPLAETPSPQPYVYPVALASNGDGFAAAIDEGSSRVIYRFDADGKIQRPGARLVVDAGGYRKAAMASDGRDYMLVVADPYKYTLEAVRLPAEGGSVPPVRVERSLTNHAVNLALTWRGDAYVLSFRTMNSPEFRTLTLDRTGDVLTGHEAIGPAHYTSPGSLISLRARSLLAWTTADARTVSVREVQPSSEITTLASYGAFDQDMEATAASSAGTLFVWREDGVLRSGFRTTAGAWSSDQSLDIDLTEVLLASNGREFLLVGKSAESSGVLATWRALRLSPSGKPLGESVKIVDRRVTSFRGIAWNGKRYVIAGVVENGVMALGIDSSLTVTAPAYMRSTGWCYGASVASDGTNVVVAWIQNRPTMQLQVERLGPDLQFLDAAPQKIAEHRPLNLLRATPLAWDGKHYFVGWQPDHNGAIHIARIDRDGHRAGIDFEVPTYGEGRTFASVYDLAILPAGGNLAVVWRDGTYTHRSTEFRLVRNGQIFLERSWDPVIGRLHLVQLGDRVGLAAAWPQNAAPYHGAARVMLAIAEAAPRELPELPDAPQLIARLVDSDSVKLTWTAPTGAINGYRIESSIEGGPWKEIEHWFGATETSAPVRLARPGARVMFRMRAWNDAGAGEYSDEALAANRRRRAVR